MPLDKVHLPTGVVTIEAVVRLLIAELGVAPIATDWPERLARNAAVASGTIGTGGMAG